MVAGGESGDWASKDPADGSTARGALHNILLPLWLPLYRKHTHLWSNNPHLEARACRKDCPHWDTVKKCHPASAPRGPNHYEDRKQNAYGMRGFSVTDLYRMPPALCDSIAAASAH